MSKGVIIRKGTLGANRLGSADSITGLLLPGVAVPDKIALGEAKVIYTPRDADTLGLDAKYDLDNKVRVRYHIDEFYRMAGLGTQLHFMLVPQAKTMTQLSDIEDADNYARKLVIAANGEIRQLGIALNPAPAYVPVMLNGINADVFSAIAKAQGLAEWCYDTFRPLNVILEGRDYAGPAAAAQDLRAIPNLKGSKVSVTIGQDYEYASTLDAIGKKHAALGTAIGCVASAAINQNIGEVEAFNLTDAIKGKFLTAGLSSHEKASDLEHDWETLDRKGFIFAHTYTGVDGARWNNDHTCTPVERDEDGKISEYSISLGRTVDKAVRKLRTALLPKVKSVQPVNPKSGKLPIGIVKYFEGLGDKELGVMEGDFEISAGKTYVDPDSNLLVIPRKLIAGFSITPYGTIDEIEGTINLSSTL